jgi:malonyl-CoA O-methyltransferase
MLKKDELTVHPDFGPALFPQDDLQVKQGIRRNFARRARSYDRHASIQRVMAHGLVAVAQDAISRARRILEIGCGTGYLTQLLRQANREACLVALDLDVVLVETARRRLGADAGVAWLVADGEAPLRGTYDLIIANATFQWFTRPADTMADYCQSLAPGGILSFSTLGPRTFRELAEALTQAAENLNHATAPRIPAQGFWDRDTWSDLLSGAGFRQVKVVQERITTTFPSVPKFLKTLHATGATNPRPSLFSPRLLNSMIAAYQAGYGKNDIPVTYEMIWAVAEK